jgi:ABC-type bacteriocin/lantibiotic exporter with double-glycine peptidase domain
MPQRKILFHCTVAENISMQPAELTDMDRVRDVCAKATISSEIEALEHGFDTVATDEVISSLSEGQIQRVMLARTLYKQARFLLIDEFSSSLDNQTKMSIVKMLKNERAGIVTVTHDPDVMRELSDGGVYRIGEEMKN